jgi:hypothetical protein
MNEWVNEWVNEWSSVSWEMGAFVCWTQGCVDADQVGDECVRRDG